MALCRHRMRGRIGAKLAWLAALLAAVVLFALGSAAVDSARLELAGWVTHSARWVAWLAAAPFALSIAHRPAERDREDGIEHLALSSGSSRGELGAARLVAAMQELCVRIALPSMAVTLGLAAMARSAPLLAHALLLLVFAFVAAACLGLVTMMAGYYGGARGRWLLVAVIVVPWALSDLWRAPGWSLPGALDALLVLLQRPIDAWSVMP